MNNRSNKGKKGKRSWRKRALSVLSAIVVFITAYALILPAITVDQSMAKTEAGFFLENEKASDDAATTKAEKANASDDASVSMASDTAADTQAEAMSLSTTSTAADVKPATTVSEEPAQNIPAAQIPQKTDGVIAMPAQELFAELKDYTVKVSAPEGSLPEGTSIVLEAIPADPKEDPDYISAFSDRIEEQILTVRKEARLTEAGIEATAELEDGRTVDEAIYDAVDEMIADRASSYKEGTVLHNIDGTLAVIQAFSIKYIDADGNEIYPTGKVNVTVTTGAVTKEQTLITSESRPEEYTASAEDIMVVRLTDKVTKDDVAFAKAVGIDTDKKEVIFDTDTFDGNVPGQGVCPSYALITTEEPDISAITEELSEVAADEDGTDDVENADDTEIYFSDDNHAANDETTEADGEKDAAAIDAETVSDASGAEDPSDVVAEAAGTLNAEGKGYNVSLTYDAKAGIPDGATLSVKEFRKGFPKYRKYLSQAEDSLKEADENASEIQFARFYDITILDEEGNEVEPATPVRVEITYDEAIEAAKGAAFKAVHFGDEETEVIAAKADGDVDTVSTVSFAAENFSVYGIVYTVDFEYVVDGQKYAFSMAGGDSIDVGELLEKIGVCDAANRDAFVAEIATVEFSDPELVEVVHTTPVLGIGRESWVLKSLAPFSTEETLTVTMKDGQVFEIKVTDAQGQESTDLRNFITDVSIINSSGESVIEDGNKIVVSSEKSYDLTFTFQESADWQFNNDGELEYPIPDGVSIGNTSGTFDIKVGTRTITGNTYEIKDGKLVIKLNTSHRNFRFLRTATDTKIDLTFSAKFDTSKTQIDFGIQDQTFGLVGHDVSNASVEKSGYYDAGDKKMHYTVAVKSTEGTSSNINVKDILSGTALSNAQITSVSQNDANGQWVKNLSAGTDYTVNSAESGFDITIPTLPEGNTVYINYSADVNVQGIENNGNATFSETGNTVNITADGDENPDDNTDTHEQKDITFSSISKVPTSTSDVVDASGNAWTEDSTGQKYRIVTWKVTANPEQLVSLGDSAITDTLLNNNEVAYYGDGIKVTKILGNTTTTSDVAWSAVGVTDKENGDHWSYNVVDSDNAAYEITYKTLVKVPDGTNTLDVSNRASDKYGDDTARVTIQPDVKKEEDKSPLTITKYATDVNPETTTWKIAVNVPAGYEGKIDINDTLPTKGGYYDAVKSITVDGYSKDTDYTYNIVHATQRNYETGEDEVIGDESFALTFPNITSSTENRVINITVVLENNQEWLEKSMERDAQGNYTGGWLNDHENKAQATDKDGKGSNESKDTAVPKPKTIDKSLANGGISNYKYYDNEGNIIGQYPKFQFEVIVSGVDSGSIDITDTFNTDLFEVLSDIPAYNYSNWEKQTMDYNLSVAYSNSVWQWDTTNNMSSTKATVDTTSTGAVFHLTNLPKTEGNAYYGFYRLHYYLIVKPDKIDDFKAYIAEHGTPIVDANGNVTGKQYTFENIAGWDTISDSGEFPYTVENVFLKTGIDNNDGTYSYTIKLNPDKLKINGGTNIDMEDVFSGAQVTASTINITATNKNGQSVAYKLYASEEAAAADTTFDGIVIIYDGASDKVITVEIPDETSVEMTYTAASTGDVTINTETGKAVEKVTNTATALDYHYTVEFTHEYDIINKTKQDNADGTVTFTIDFNPSKAKLNGGENITLTDTYSGNLTINDDSFAVTVCEPDEDNTKASAILASKSLNDKVYTFTIPDSTHVTITYTGTKEYQVDASGKITASYTNTAEALDIPKVITDTTETDMLTKTSTDILSAEESETNPGYLKFTITFNPLGQPLNDGDDIELKDEFTKLIVDYSTVKINPEKYPAGHPNAGDPIVFDFSGNTGTFQVPDATPVTITYLAIPDYSYGTTVEWTNKVSAAGFKEEITDSSTQSSSGGGTATNTASLWLLKYETGHMERKMDNVTFRLYMDDGAGGLTNPVLKKDGTPLTFTTENDETMGHGYTRMELSSAQNQFTDGDNGFKEDTVYFLVEQGTIDGYYQNTTVYNFVYHPRTKVVHNDETGEDEVVENDPYVKPTYMAGTAVYLFGNEEIVKVTNDKITQDVSIQKYWVNGDGGWDWPEGVETVTMKLQESKDNGTTWKDISVENNNIPAYYWDSENKVVVTGEDGSTWSDTLVLDKNNTRKSWSNLDIDEDISYRVVETKINGVAVTDGKATVNGKTYEVLGGEVKNGKATVTNAERTNIEFEKKWQNISSTVTWTVPDMVTYVEFNADTAHHDTVTATTNTENKSKLRNGAPSAGEDTVTFDFSKLRLIVELKRYTYKGGDKIEVPFDLTDEHEARLAGAKTLYGEENTNWGSPTSGHWASEFVETGFWKGEWKNLPMAGLDEDGNEVDYVYEVREIAVLPSRQALNDVNNHYIDISDIFSTSYSTDASGKKVITNTLKDDDNYYLNVTKEWRDYTGQTTTGEAVEFQLIRSGSRTTINGSSSEDSYSAYLDLQNLDITENKSVISLDGKAKAVLTVWTDSYVTDESDISKTSPYVIQDADKQTITVKKWPGAPSNTGWQGDIIETINPTVNGNKLIYEIPVNYSENICVILSGDRTTSIPHEYRYSVPPYYESKTDTIEWQSSLEWKQATTTEEITGQVMKPDGHGGYEVDETNEYKFTIQPGETVSFASLPYNVATSQTTTETYTYTVRETSTGTNWHVVTGTGTYNPAPGTGQEGGQNGSVTLVNQYDRTYGSVKVKKTFSGINDLPEGFKIKAEYTVDGEKHTVNLTTNTTGMTGTGTATDPYIWTIADLPVGTEVTFTETGYEAQGYNVTVTANGTDVTNAEQKFATASSADPAGEASFVNTYEQFGSLKVKKVVTVDNNAPTDANKSLTNGSYELAVVKKDDETVTHTITITYSGGEVTAATVDGETVTPDSDGYVTLSGLAAGDYVITETAPTNGSTLTSAEGGKSVSDDKKVTVTVVAGDTVEDTAKATFINNAETTSIKVKKEWGDSKDHSNVTIPFTVVQFRPTSGTEYVATDYTVTSSVKGDGTVTEITGLPKYGFYDGARVTYRYDIIEGKPDETIREAYTASRGTTLDDGTLVMVNTPVSDKDKHTDLTVEKIWKDGDKTVSNTNDSITFRLERYEISTDYVPVEFTNNAYNFSGNQASSGIWYVPKNSYFEITFNRFPIVGFGTIYYSVNGTDGTIPDNGKVSLKITEPTKIDVGGWGTASNAQSANGTVSYSTAAQLVEAKKNSESTKNGAYEYTYNYTSSSVTSVDGAPPATTEANSWIANLNNLDEYVASSGKIYTYQITEVKINDDPVILNQTDDYSVSIAESSTTAGVKTTITNTKKDHTELVVEKKWLGVDGVEMETKPNVIVEFKLTQHIFGEDGTEITSRAYVNQSNNGVYELKVDNSWQQKFDGLPKTGTYSYVAQGRTEPTTVAVSYQYSVEETKINKIGQNADMIDEYNISYQFTVKNGSNPDEVTSEYLINGDGTLTITNKTNSSVELPSTGGSGTTLFTIIGSILMAFAGSILLLKRRRLAYGSNTNTTNNSTKNRRW